MCDVDNITCRCCVLSRSIQYGGVYYPACPNIPYGWSVYKKTFISVFSSFEFYPICLKYQPTYAFYAVDDFEKFFRLWTDQWGYSKRRVPLVRVIDGKLDKRVFDVPLYAWQRCQIFDIPGVATASWEPTSKGVKYLKRVDGKWC